MPIETDHHDVLEIPVIHDERRSSVSEIGMANGEHDL